jgi:hypothetical protein
MTEIFLKSIPCVTTNLSEYVSRKWHFFQPDEEQLMALEHRYGSSFIHSSKGDDVKKIDEYRLVKQRISTHIVDIDKFIKEKGKLLQQTAINNERNTEFVDNVIKIIGPRRCVMGFEWGWVVETKNMHIKLFVNWMKNPNGKTLRLESKKNSDSQWKCAFYNQKQVLTFLRKHDSKLSVSSQQEIELLRQTLQATHIDPNPQQQTTSVSDTNEKIEQICETLQTTHIIDDVVINDEVIDDYIIEPRKMKCSMFINNISKSRRILYQSCKESEDQYKYLLRQE